MYAPGESRYKPIQAENRLLILVSTDNIFCNDISRQIKNFGYSIQSVPQLKSAIPWISTQKKITILIDLSSLHNDDVLDANMFQELSHPVFGGLPLIFFSEQDDLLVRVKTLRAGGVAFFKKPVDIVRLVDRLDRLGDVSPGVPYRVLIIDDQVPVARYYQMILKMAGIEAQIAADPGEVFAVLEEFHPDLILLNLLLPQVSGIELAKIIRQMDEYVHIPILFVSNEDDSNKQIEALSLGGDDFLIKPIKAAHLVAMVKSRLERLKTLRVFMVRDSLTGLLNHTSFLTFFHYEFNHCLRQNARMALAVLDIDHFKKVNDSHGHIVGDYVLISLARLIRQRLRKSDLIGRYGGEEFVILLMDVDVETAYSIMDEIRRNFFEMEFTFKQQAPFSVSFSCGLASFPEYSSPESLLEAADQAMYQAKSGNRNQVIIAQA